MSEALGIGIRYEGPEKLTSLIGECAKSHALEFSDVSGFGELEWIELDDKTKGERKRYQGPFQLLSLKGRLRVVGEVLISDLMCTVSRETDNGIQLIGGLLLEAEVRYLELTFLPLIASEVDAPSFDTQDYGKALSKNPEYDAGGETAQMGHWREPGQPAESRDREDDLDERWSLAIAESNLIRGKKSDESETSDERPGLGDVVIHRQFGKCKVTRVGDSHITLRKPDSRNVQLGLSILKFKRENEDDEGRAVFSVTVSPRR